MKDAQIHTTIIFEMNFFSPKISLTEYFYWLGFSPRSKIIVLALRQITQKNTFQTFQYVPGVIINPKKLFTNVMLSTNECDHITEINYYCFQAAQIAYFSVEGELITLSAEKRTPTFSLSRYQVANIMFGTNEREHIIKGNYHIAPRPLSLPTLGLGGFRYASGFGIIFIQCHATD